MYLVVEQNAQLNNSMNCMKRLSLEILNRSVVYNNNLTHLKWIITQYQYRNKYSTTTFEIKISEFRKKEPEFILASIETELM